MKGGTEPSVDNVYGKLFPKHESRLTYSCTHTGQWGYDKLCRSDMTVVLGLPVANGADVREHHRKLLAF